MNVVAALRRLPPLETALFVLGVVVAVALATGAGVEQQPLPLDSFSSYDAASGGYRAYYTLLERLGVRVARFERRPAFLGAGIDTLAYVEPYDFDPRAVRLTAADLAALEAWVRAGGRLLYVGRDDVAAKNGLLHLPFGTRESDRAHAPFIAAQIARDDVRHVRAETHFRWKPSKHRFDVLVDDGRGPLAVTYAFGRGRVTALIDEALLRNDGIGTPDRARLGYALAAPGRANGTVAFDETPHGYIVEAQWWQVVPRAFAIAIGIAFAAIVIALAGAAVRFGPPIVPIERRERSSAEFVDALSSLLERGNAVRKASLDAAASTTRTIARALGASDRATPDDVVNLLDGASRADYRAMLAVTSNGYPNDANLVRGIALAQRLRKDYAAHGRHGT